MNDDDDDDNDRNIYGLLSSVDVGDLLSQVKGLACEVARLLARSLRTTYITDLPPASAQGRHRQGRDAWKHPMKSSETAL